MNDFRRHDDDPLYERISRLEHQVGTLESKVHTLTIEQKHMLDLFGARFTSLERSQDLAIAEMRQLNSTLSAMASEADKSPAGRMLLRQMQEMERGGKDRQDALDHLCEWQHKVDGVLVVLKWMGASGVAALIWVALRAFGQVP